MPCGYTCKSDPGRTRALGGGVICAVSLLCRPRRGHPGGSTCRIPSAGWNRQARGDGVDGASVAPSDRSVAEWLSGSSGRARFSDPTATEAATTLVHGGARPTTELAARGAASLIRTTKGPAPWCRTLLLVGVTGFEPAASSSRTKRATKLRHTPVQHRKGSRGPGRSRNRIRPRDHPAGSAVARDERQQRRLRRAREPDPGVRRGADAGADVQPARARRPARHRCRPLA